LHTTAGARLLVFASEAGPPTNPDWSHNRVAHREVTGEVGTEQHPGMAESQAKTTRTIPVLARKQVR
jgi:hypothetical protein